MNKPDLSNKQLRELDSLFKEVSKRQIKDFGNISASNKSDGSLITSCDLWSDKTIVDGLASIAPDEGVLSEEGGKLIPSTKAYWIVDPLDGTKDFIQGTGNYAMHLALNYKKKPYISVVLLPEKDELWISVRYKVWCEKRDGLVIQSNLSNNNTLKKNNVLDNNYFRRVQIKNPTRKINNYGSKSDKNLINRRLTYVRNKGSVPPSKKK